MRFTRIPATAIAVAFALSGCGGNAVTPGAPAPANAAAAQRNARLQAFVRPHGKKITVKPGQSIQAAVDSASSGDTILVEPGTYHETGRPCPFKSAEMCAISVTKDDISIVGLSGASPVVLENASKSLDIGIGVGKYYKCGKQYLINGAYLAGFTVTGFNDTGIELTCVDKWEWAFDTATSNKIYDFYPVFSSNGRLDNSFASDATDTGFYVGISDHIRVDHNIATDNVSGYEFENTIDSLMDHNTAYNNTGGILEFIIPGDPLERSYGNVIEDNVVNANNNANKCTAGVVCTVPPGTGILDIGGTSNKILNNSVENNMAYGIALTDVCTAFTLTPAQCKALKYNPDEEQNQISGNEAVQNGLDLAWEPQLGKGNCWSHNRSTTRTPNVLPVCK